MSRGLVYPLFPSPPEAYDPFYQSEVMRAFSVFLQQVSNPGPWQASALTLPNLQTDNYALPLGGVFQYGDELRITVSYLPYARGSQATGSAGQTTVVIT